MLDTFKDFFDNTGMNADSFETNIQKAKQFGLKINDFIKPELDNIVQGEKTRSERLNAKPEVVSGVKNSYLFYVGIGVSLYLVYKILK